MESQLLLVSGSALSVSSIIAIAVISFLPSCDPYIVCVAAVCVHVAGQGLGRRLRLPLQRLREWINVVATDPSCFLVAISSLSSCVKWAQVLSTLLRRVGRLGPSDEKNLVRRERPVGLRGGRNVYRVALGQGHLCRCSFSHRNIWGHGDCLRTVLIMNQQSGATTLPYRSIGHARI